MSVIVEEKTPFIRSQVYSISNLVQQSVDTIDQYSPVSIKNLQDGVIETLDTWTPQNVKEKVGTVKQSLENTLDATDDILQRTLDFTEEYSTILNQEAAYVMLQNMKDGAETKMESVKQLLPSDKLKDLLLKSRVQELVNLLGSQREHLVDQAQTIQFKLHESLDKDQDGKVSAKDLATNVSGFTLSIFAYCSNLLLPFYEKVMAPYRELLKTVGESDQMKSVVKTVETVQKLAVKLLPASKMLKTYVSTYTDNVQSKIKPLTPYFRNLVTSTAVVDLPVQLMKLAVCAINVKCTGKKTELAGEEDESETKERRAVVEEATALFWALIDISFMIELMNMPIVKPVTPKEQSNESQNDEKTFKIEKIEDSDALKDTAWLKGVTSLSMP